MTPPLAPTCPHCGQTLDGISDGAGVRCRSCAALIAPDHRGDPPAGKPRHAGYLIAVLVSTVICMLLILGLIVVTGVYLIRG